jgi:hypothetical protein
MTVTRAQVEKLLVRRAGKRMAFIDMEITTTGANSDLADPISQSLLVLGIAPSDFTEPADSDLVNITGDNLSEMLDRAELRLLENIRGNFDMVDFSNGSQSESLSQFSRDLDAAIKNKQAQIAVEYGVAANSLSAGIISQNFQQKGDDPVLY